MGWGKLDHLGLFIWWELKLWDGITFSWGGRSSNRCENEELSQQEQKTPLAGRYIFSIASLYDTGQLMLTCSWGVAIKEEI